MRSHVLIVSVVASLASQAVPADTVSPDRESSRIQTVSTLISRLQLAADSGKLDDSAAVGQLLGMSFDSDVKEEIPQPANCTEQMNIKHRQVKTYRLKNDSWYRPTSSGVATLNVPGFAINPAFVIDETHLPEVQYLSHRLVYCGDPQVTTRETTDTQLIFFNLPRFACISVSDIRSLLPKAALHQATDGYSFYYYPGNVNGNNGTHLEFSFRAFVSCALDAKVVQSARAGLRYRRAGAVITPCRKKAMEEYREIHSPIKWTDARDLDTGARYAEDIQASNRHMVRACGTFEEQFQERYKQEK